MRIGGQDLFIKPKDGCRRALRCRYSIMATRSSTRSSPKRKPTGLPRMATCFPLGPRQCNRFLRPRQMASEVFLPRISAKVLASGTTITSELSIAKFAYGLTARKCRVALTFVRLPDIFASNRKEPRSISGRFAFGSCHENHRQKIRAAPDLYLVLPTPC